MEYILATAVLVGVFSFKRSLDLIEKNTSKLEKYASEIYQKAKKMENVINNFKQSLNQSELDTGE